MTPKEKAKELVFKYENLVTGWDCHYDTEILLENKFPDMKECALIAVKNEYHSLRELLFNLRSCDMIQDEKVYLFRLQNLIDEEKEIIKEIENL